jgi:hypothetical protein
MKLVASAIEARGLRCHRARLASHLGIDPAAISDLRDRFAGVDDNN